MALAVIKTASGAGGFGSLTVPTRSTSTAVPTGETEYPAVPTGETAQELQTTAEHIGSGNLDPDSTPPSTAQVVLSTRREALTATSGAQDYTLDSSAPVYVVQLEGSIIGCQAKVFDPSSIPTGRALYFLFDPSSGQLTDWGIRLEPIDLSTLGKVSDISVKLQALPCTEP
jgi:hypothetical protein